MRPMRGERTKGPRPSSPPPTAARVRWPGRGEPISDAAREPPTSEGTRDEPGSERPRGESRGCLGGRGERGEAGEATPSLAGRECGVASLKAPERGLLGSGGDGRLGGGAPWGPQRDGSLDTGWPRDLNRKESSRAIRAAGPDALETRRVRRGERGPGDSGALEGTSGVGDAPAWWRGCGELVPAEASGAKAWVGAAVQREGRGDAPSLRSEESCRVPRSPRGEVTEVSVESEAS